MPGKVNSSVKDSDWLEDHWRAEWLSAYVTAGIFARWIWLIVDFFAKPRAVLADADRSEHWNIIDVRSADSEHTTRIDVGSRDAKWLSNVQLSN